MSLSTTIIGTVTVTTRGSVSLRSYAYAYSDYYYYQVLGNEFWRYYLTPTLRTQPSFWNGTSNVSSVCYDNGVPVISTPLTIYLSSPLYIPTPLYIMVSIWSDYPHYYTSRSYTITITTPDCTPNERFDQISQKCVTTCGCGLVNHKPTFCLQFSKPPCKHLAKPPLCYPYRSVQPSHICTSIYQLHCAIQQPIHSSTIYPF